MSDIKRYRSARIIPVLNGFIIEVGCQKVVAETGEKLIELVSNYIKDPGKMEQEMLKYSLSFDNQPPAEIVPRRTEDSGFPALIREAQERYPMPASPPAPGSIIRTDS